MSDNDRLPLFDHFILIDGSENNVVFFSFWDVFANFGIFCIRKKGGSKMENYYIRDNAFPILKKDMKLIKNGKEHAKFYRYQDLMVKLYHEKEGAGILSKEQIQYLEDLSTNRILLPISYVTDESQTEEGYTIPFVSKKEEQRSLFQTPVADLWEELALVKEDIERMNDAHVLLDCLEEDRAIFNGKLYVKSPDYYQIIASNDSLFSRVPVLNYARINQFLRTLVLYRYFQESGDYRTYASLFKYWEEKKVDSPYSYLGDFLKAEVTTSTMEEYISEKKKTLKR